MFISMSFQMESLTVAISDTPHFNIIRHDSFKFLELFAKIFKLKLNFILWKNCTDYGQQLESDAYIVDYDQEFKECLGGNISLHLVIEFQAITILVPSFVKKPKYTYFRILNFDIRVCSLIIICLFAFLTVLISKFKLQSLDNSKELLKGVGLLHGQSISIFSKDISLLRCIYIAMSILGILLQNYYNIYLSSYLIKGIDDTNIKILCSKSDFRFINTSYPSIRKQFSFTEVPEHERITSILSLNVTLGRCIRTQGWLKRLNRDIRYKSRIYRRAAPWMYGFDPILLVILNKKSKHSNNLNKFLLNIYSHGFTKHWSRQMMIHNYAKRSIEIMECTNSGTVITLKDFRSCFIYHLVMIIVCCFVFILEWLWWKMKKCRS